eukprot:Platyproteum_vivax@DN5234_c0_g1_i1.p2
MRMNEDESKAMTSESPNDEVQIHETSNPQKTTGLNTTLDPPESQPLEETQTIDQGKPEKKTPGQRTSWSGWFMNAVNSVNESVTAATQIVSEDVKEFSTQIVGDTSKFFENRVHVVKEFASKNRIFDDGNDDENEEDLQIPPNPTTTPLPAAYQSFSSRLISQLVSLRNDTKTYLEEPTNKQYTEFSCDSYEVLDWTNDSVVMYKSKQLVPNQVSEEEFWRRFLFKIHLLKQQEALICNVATTQLHEEEDFDWDTSHSFEKASMDPPPVVLSPTPPPSPKPTVQHTSEGYLLCTEESETDGMYIKLD